MSTTRAHYEKVICACCVLLLFTNVGLASTSFNVYQPYIVAAVGDENGSNVLLMRTLVSLLSMMMVGRWYDLFNCRLGAFLASCLTAFGFLLFSFADGLIGYFGGAIFIGAGYGLGGMVVGTILINRWYSVGVGTAMGIVAAGSSIAAIIMPMISTFMVHNLSLSWSFLFESILAICIGTICFIFLRNHPSDLGMVPYGSADADEAAIQTKSSSTTTHKQKVPLSSRVRLILWIAMLFMGCVSVDSWNYMSVLMTHAGFDPYFAATLLSVAAIAMLVGKLAAGKLFDKIGTLKASILFFSILLVGLLLCSLADLGNHAIMVLAVVLLGLGVCLGTVGISIWSIHFSTPEDGGKLIKNFQVAYAAGGFIFNLVPGRIVEAGGSYTTSYLILAALCVVEAVIVITIYLQKERDNA